MSILAIKHPSSKDLTREIASSKEEYLTVKKSKGTPSLMEAPIGEERSNIMRRGPSFLGTAPNGEQWNGEKGRDEKGPT